MNSERLNTLDNMIAKAMWDADKRPCNWTELDSEEMAEWETMAAAARNFLVRYMGAVIDTKSLIREKDIVAGIGIVIKNLAISAIREAA